MATRRERVVLELDDNFTAPMARAAAAAALLNKELGGLSRDSVRTNRSVSDIDRNVTRMSGTFERTGNDIDRFSGRLGLLRDALIVLGPTAVPITAAVVPAVAGLANQLGFAAIAGGTAVLAFHGVGDALKALNDYQVQPTEAHLQKLNQTMQALGPAGRDFVRALDALGPQLHALQSSAQAGLFPGLTDAITTITTRAPELQRIVSTVASTLGDLAAEAGDALSGPEWDSFFNMLETEAKPALTDMGHAIGSVVHGLAELSVAFTPLSNDFGRGLADMAADFDRWASGLSQTEGFQHFLDYVRENGPRVLALLGAVGDAFVEMARAAAPLGGPILQALTAVAKAVAAIAGSDFGTPIVAATVALVAFNRAMQGAQVAQTKFASVAKKTGFATLATDLRQYLNFGVMTREEMQAQNEAGERLKSTLGGAAASVGLLAVASSGLADKMGLSNTASLAFAGTLASPGFGTAIGAAVGAILDMQHANDGLNQSIATLGEQLRTAVQNGDSQAIHQTAGQIHQLTAAFGDDLPGPLKDATKGLRDLDAQATSADVGISDMADSTSDLAQQMSPAARSMQEVTQAMLDQKNAALGAFDAETQWRQALVDAQKQAQKSNAGIKGNSAEAIANRQAISQLAAAWNNQSEAVRNNTARFQSARRAFIQTAVDMGVPIKRARELANAMLAVPSKKVIEVSAETKQAQTAIQKIVDGLKNVHDKSFRITAYVNQVNALGKGHVLPGQAGQADGGMIPKDGGLYADRFLYMLAPGEQVISNRYGQADRFRADSAAGRIPGYADGGTVIRPGTTTAYGMTDLVHGNDLKTPLTLAAAIRSLQKWLDDHDKASKAQRAAIQKQLERLGKLQDAVKAFDLSGVLPTQDPTNPIWAGVKGQLDDFAKAVKSAGFHWTGAMHDEQVSLLAHALKLDQLNREQDRLTQTISDQQQAYDDLQQQMKDFGDSVADRFTSQLFGQTDANGNPVPASVQGLIATLTGDTSNLNAFGQAFNTLSGKGLDTGLLNIFGQQASLADLQSLAQSTTAADIAALNQAFGGRGAAASALSQTVGFDVFGKQLGDMGTTLQQSLAEQQANTAAIHAQTAAIIAGQNSIVAEVRRLPGELQRLLRK